MHDAAHSDIVHFILQLSVILIAARLSGTLFERLFRLPRVIGELAVGMAIGPYALGRIDLPAIGPLFPFDGHGLPIMTELHALATMASVILLFHAGVETDLAGFVRYSLAGTAVGVGGVVFSFALGAWSAVWFGLADSMMSPTALYLGTIATATSVGITARILGEKRKIDSPEGSTILAGAVIDDVLCVLLFAVAVGLAGASGQHAEMAWSVIFGMSAKILGFAVGATLLVLLLSKRIAWAMKVYESPDAVVIISLGLAFFLAGLSEMAGLAMIVGAYIMGLGLSRTDLALVIQDELRTLYDVFVPVFFCVMGMLVDFNAMKTLLGFGLVYSLIGVASKILGCAIPARLMGFNARGALRIGVGMLPRGEVALIVAGAALASGAIGPDIFGTAVMMTVLTTLVAPPILSAMLDDRPGIPDEVINKMKEDRCELSLSFPNTEVAEFLRTRVLRALHNEEFFMHRLPTEAPTYQIRKDDIIFTLGQRGHDIILTTTAKDGPIAKMLILEELVALQHIMDSCMKIRFLDSMEKDLASNLFSDGPDRSEIPPK